MFRFRRRLRLYAYIGVIIIFVLFVIMMIQFNQIESSNEKRLKKKPPLNRGEKEQFLLNRYDKLKNKNVPFQIRNPKNFLTDQVDKEDTLGNPNEMNSNIMQKTMSSLQRIVHLDLKGSPPKLNYLKELIPFFKSAGATGILVEYEDFFPYSSDLESIKNQNHYTNQELIQLFKLIKESGLNLIPLIQTFGHMEFVLKLKQYAYLRESKEHFQVITPCLNDSYEKVLFRMLDQVIDSHPEDLEYIHIGCDEVYFINVHPECKNLNLNSKQDFFVHHVSKLVDYIKKKRPNLNVIIWDDMLRKNLKITKPMVKFSKRVIPMVWDYNEDVTERIHTSVWKNYEKLFPEIWIASAFKGATHQLELIPNANKHYLNQLSWLNMISKLSNPSKIRGIALTGWSRYDHMQSVCEIMPSAIPSLVLCLQTLINYDQSDDIIMTKTKELTKCTYNKSEVGFILDPSMTIRSLTPAQYDCTFPGSNMYTWLLNLKTAVQYFEQKHYTYNMVLNSYNLKNNFFNTMSYIQATQNFYPNIKKTFKEILATGETQFDKYFYADLFEEISHVYILRYIEMIDTRLLELNKTKLPEFAPLRPINKISQSLV